METIILAVIIIAMFSATVYGVNMISEKGRVVKVQEVTTTSYLTNAACVSIAIITVAYDVACLYVLVRVV